MEKECNGCNCVMERYLKGLNAPTIRDKIIGHNITFMRDNYSYLNNLELADTGGGGRY